MLLSLCVAMWRLPATIDTFAGTLGGGASTDESVRAALNAAAGRNPSATGPSSQRVFAAGGRELTDDERAALLKQARALSPAPLITQADPSADSGAPLGEDTTDKVNREIDRLLAEHEPPR